MRVSRSAGKRELTMYQILPLVDLLNSSLMGTSTSIPRGSKAAVPAHIKMTGTARFHQEVWSYQRTAGQERTASSFVALNDIPAIRPDHRGLARSLSQSARNVP